MEESVQEMMERRNKLIVEVAQMRKTYPSKILHMKEKIHALECKQRESESFSLDEDLANYKMRRPNDDIAVRNFEEDAKRVRKVLEDIDTREKLMNERCPPKTDFSEVLRELTEASEHLRMMTKVQEQLAHEDPVLKKTRSEYL